MRCGTLKAARRAARNAFTSSSSMSARVCTTAAGTFAQGRMGKPQQRRIGDGGMLAQGAFDLDAIDVLAAADHHVLEAVDDAAEAFRSMTARSPVLTQPSWKTAAVSSGRFQ